MTSWSFPARLKPRLAAALVAIALAGGAAAAPVLAQQAPIRIAQSAETAQLNVRIAQLEEQIRNLTGQVEGLQFQVTQMQTLIERMTEDYERRFTALEGGAPAPQPGAAPAAAPAAPPAQSIPEIGPEGVLPEPGELEFDPSFEDGVGASGDPLLGTGAGETGAQLGVLSTGEVIDGSLSVPLVAGPSEDPDALAQFEAGYEAILEGDFQFAADQFRQYVALYPNSPRAADATHWLGEALIQIGDYEQAAEVLLTGFQTYQSSERAPDMLLKLGVALNGAGERDTACRTFAETRTRYADVSPAFTARLQEEANRAQCPPI